MDGGSSADIELHNEIAASPAAVSGRLTMLSANLLNPFGHVGRLHRQPPLDRLEAFRRLVQGERADILLCQEVGRSRDFRIDEWIARRLGLSWVYLRANGQAAKSGHEEGLAIFSCYPLSGPITRELAGGLWRRPALGAIIQTPLGEIAVYTAHLSLRPWRNRRQPEALQAWVEVTTGERTAVVGGDFNAGENAAHIVALRSAWIDTFRELNPVSDGTTHAIKLFGRELRHNRLDYLFLRSGTTKIRIVNSRHISSPGVAFSDHLAVSATFELAE